ncbi:hypothetical protein [Blautia sp. LMAG:75]|nr:hypothetical protein [Blautia sp. LMAG:75]
MQDAEPETENGNKTYAISGWSDWGLWMWTIPYQAMSGLQTGPTACATTW